MINVKDEEHRFLTSEQLPEIGVELGSALLDSLVRNTTPALTSSPSSKKQNGKSTRCTAPGVDRTASTRAVDARLNGFRSSQKPALVRKNSTDRAEHWVVVTASAEITNRDKVLTLTGNQSAYSPLGKVHRLANPSTIPLEIIYVQPGRYLGEDDIIFRFEDTYRQVQ